MNERIQKLLPKSKKVQVITNAGMGYDTKEYFTQEQLEKFAKLIARAYGNIVLHYTDVDEGVKVANKHFGVEV